MKYLHNVQSLLVLSLSFHSISSLSTHHTSSSLLPLSPHHISLSHHSPPSLTAPFLPSLPSLHLPSPPLPSHLLPAMSYPHNDAFHGHHLEEVRTFLDERHPSAYLVFNLSGNGYDVSKLNNQVREVKIIIT